MLFPLVNKLSFHYFTVSKIPLSGLLFVLILFHANSVTSFHFFEHGDFVFFDVDHCFDARLVELDAFWRAFDDVWNQFLTSNSSSTQWTGMS